MSTSEKPLHIDIPVRLQTFGLPSASLTWRSKGTCRRVLPENHIRA
jgi:hypothetical protein